VKYVVDTNVFNKLLDGKLELTSLPSDGEFVATHIQVDEINNTSNPERRSRLQSQFASVAPTMEPTESMVLDVSRWDSCKWGDGVTLSVIKSDLDALNGSKANNIHDALIAEVALKNGFVLLTCDRDLDEVARKHGVKVHHYAT